MGDLVFLAFPTEQKAEEVRKRLLELQREYLIGMSDAVVVVKDEAGVVKLSQLMNMTALGAASGAMWGTCRATIRPRACCAGTIAARLLPRPARGKQLSRLQPVDVFA
jgi:hypothetical protein